MLIKSGRWLATIVLMCAALAAVAPSAQPAGQAVAASSISPEAARPAADPSRETVVRSATTVATNADVASPAVRSLPSVATTAGEMPLVALDAYTRAAQVIDSVKPGCHLTWAVLAAVGQIESDHGRSAGGQLLVDGTPSRPIRGKVLDGSGSSARVADTDGGLLDEVAKWDRAVGPMQFLPSTWISVRVDGDGDGVRSPDDLDDASLAAAVFLCAWDDDVSSQAGAQRAIGRYNHTRGYVPAVLSLARGYAAWTYDPYAWQYAMTSTWSSASYLAAPMVAETESMPGSTTSTEPSDPAPTDASATPGPGAPASTDEDAPPSSGPSSSAAAAPTSEAPPAPSSTPASPPTTTASDDPVDAASPTPSPAPSPTPSPAPSPAPSPTPSPPGDAGSSTISGTLRPCGELVYCVGEATLDFGSLSAPAAADFDGDGSAGSRQAELDALVGTEVSVTVGDATSPDTVLTLNGQAW